MNQAEDFKDPVFQLTTAEGQMISIYSTERADFSGGFTEDPVARRVITAMALRIVSLGRVQSALETLLDGPGFAELKESLQRYQTGGDKLGSNSSISSLKVEYVKCADVYSAYSAPTDVELLEPPRKVDNLAYQTADFDADVRPTRSCIPKLDTTLRPEKYSSLENQNILAPHKQVI